MINILYFNDRIRALSILECLDFLTEAATTSNKDVYCYRVTKNGKSSSFEVSALEIMQAGDLQHLNNLADSRFNAALKELDNPVGSQR